MSPAREKADAPSQPVEKDITAEKGALNAVRPDSPVEPLDSDADYVEYQGKATIRRMTVEQWEQARVKDQGEVVWDATNDFRVPLSDLNEAALKALARDASFAFPQK
jgi:hypothetical protein